MNSSCDNNNMQTSCGCGCNSSCSTGCGCGGNAWQTVNQGCQTWGSGMLMGMGNTMGMTNSGSCQPTPIVMPTRVMARQAFSFVEQPVIVPVECRTINRTVLVPRFYPTYTQTVVNCQN